MGKNRTRKKGKKPEQSVVPAHPGSDHAGSPARPGGLDIPTFVPVVYVEQMLTTVMKVPAQTMIDNQFVDKCRGHFLDKWQAAHFSEAQSSNFDVRLQPQPTSSQTAGDWSGIATVSMTPEHDGEGLLGQKGKLTAAFLGAEETIAGLKVFNSKALDKLSACKKEQLALKADHQLSMDELREHLHTLLAQQHRDLMAVVHAMCEKMEGMKKELEHSTRFYKKVVDLANKVKRRVALAEARKRLCKVLGRDKGAESWMEYVTHVTDEEWASVGLAGNEVKEVLGGGAFPLNKSVHEIPPGEVIGAIFVDGIPKRDAWISVIRFAYPGEHSDLEAAYFTD